MSSQSHPVKELPRFVCDAMCGGLARWLRAFGYDTVYTDGIDDEQLLDIATAEGRIVISADGRLFERKLITSRRVRALRLPVGWKLEEQLTHVVTAMNLRPRDPRCSRCNGALFPVQRSEIADRVPARSMLLADRFYQCSACQHLFWNGTHWNRIRSVRNRFSPG